MKSKSVKSAVYAAGLVFAPSEEAPCTNTVTPRTPRVKVKSRRVKPRPAVDYEADLVKVSAARASDTNWLRTFDLSWLLGRATA